MSKNKQQPKICPIGTSVPLDLEKGLWAHTPCVADECQWWDGDDEECSIVIIAQSLNDIAAIEQTAHAEGEEWKQEEEEEEEVSSNRKPW